MDSVSLRPYALINKIQHYAWGTRGEDALIPKLLSVPAEEGVPYAELWMGAHPSAPSEVVLEGMPRSLASLIAEHPVEMLGRRVRDRFSGSLPFLLKVLSVGRPLSIQAHPNREQARRLHTQDPEHYPDDNHKPEIAVALDGMRALAGFRSLPDIVACLERTPELAELVGPELVRAAREAQGAPDVEQRAALRALYAALMRSPGSGHASPARAIADFAGRLSKPGTVLSAEEELFLELKRTYPEDVGLFSPFLLNLVHLDRDQALFVQSGLPHAYLGGNAVECMASSDNVVRAGLTPKHKDVDTLVEILTYEMGPPSILPAAPDEPDVVYRTGVSEFQLSRHRRKAGELWVRPSADAPQILLVTQGWVEIGWEKESQRESQALLHGQSLFIPACLAGFDVRAVDDAVWFVATVP